MNEALLVTCLQLFKIDMGITHNLRDVFFSNLIESSYSELKGMGIDFNSTTSTAEDTQLIVDYSSWMYRKRQEDVGLPRRLRFKINNRIISKAGATNAEP